MAATLTRALTKRMNKTTPEEPTSPTRAFSRGFSMRKMSQPVAFNRAQISLPVELISATNPLAYDAPDLRQVPNPPPISTSDASSTHSQSDSIRTPALSSSSSITSNDFSREATPVDSLPKRSLTHSHHESVKSSRDTFRSSAMSSDSEAPTVPKRALSHTKRTHQVLARQRSMSRLSSERNSSQSTGVLKARSSVEMFSVKPDGAHPFGAELAQVNELVEEFGANQVKIFDEEEQYLSDHGLQRFGVEDYLREIGGLYKQTYGVKHISHEGGWL